MDVVHYLLFLILIFAVTFISEFFKLKREVRKNSNLIKMLKKKIT
jgi:hypothetical protein